MANDLRTALSTLAQTFADSVLAAIRSSTIAELVAEAASPKAIAAKKTPQAVARPAGGGGQPDPLATKPAESKAKGKGPLPRRTPQMVAMTLAQIHGYLKKHPKGLRSEEIREALSLDRREMPRVLKLGLEHKTIKSKGVKRSTTYWAA